MRTVTLRAADIYKGSLILVNGLLPLRREPDTEAMRPVGAVLLERKAANMLDTIISLTNAGEHIVLVSGFRTLGEQQHIYSNSLRDNGAEFTSRYVALPGCSEHQTGLAVDLAENKGDIDVLRPDFPYDGVCGRFRARAAEYGFIERYPKGREHITHIAHEPWHFRYVGYPHSMIMGELGATLEEYIVYLKQFRGGQGRLRAAFGGHSFEMYFVPLDSEAETQVPDGVPYQLSGNNDDGVIVTLWETRR
jgi:D-alanyl-D-alanine dipeptidase/carboxypeptidase